MSYEVPTVDELRAAARRQGVSPTEVDLERIRGFLEILFPQLDALEALVPRDSVPAAVFPPEPGS